MASQEQSRRAYLAALGAVGFAGVAGCSDTTGESNGEEDGDGATSPNDDTNGQSVTRETAPNFGGYLEGANNYDGKTVDKTGQDEVSVKVGAGNGLAFDPAAVHVTRGTTVEWEWTGQGGSHNVVDGDTTFNSGSPQSSGTYSYTFNSDGIYKYYCVPHQGQGMLGAVVVGSDYPSYTYTPPARVWRFKTDGTIESAPTVTSGTVYIDSGTVYALNAATGDKQWTKSKADKTGFFSPAVSGDTVYVGGDGLFALDAATGQQLWSTGTGRDPPTAVAVGDNQAYIEAATLQAIDTATGDIEWSFDPDGFSPSAPIVDAGTVYVANYDPNAEVSYIHAVDATSGSVQWSIEVGALASPLTISNGVVYAGGFSRLYAFDGATGEQLWTVETSARVPIKPKVTGDYVIAGDEDGTIYGVDATTGRRPWTVEMDGRLQSLLVNGTSVYTGGSVLYEIDATSGREEVLYEGSGEVRAITDTTAYVGESDLAAVDVETGSRKWLFRTGDSVTISIVDEGTVVVGSRNGTVSALTAQ